MISRRLAALLSAALLPAMLAAGPVADAPPEGVQYEMELGLGDADSVAADVTAGAAVNIWTHMSIWDPNTCVVTSPDNRCDRTLLHFTDAGTATVGFSPAYAGADYDLVIFTSDDTGYGGRTELGRVATEFDDLDAGGEASFDVEAGDWVLAVMFYRAAGGGYELTASLD